MSSELEQSRTPTLGEVLNTAIGKSLEGVFVGLPGIVESYNAATQTAKIRPALKRPYVNEDGSEASDDLPVLEDVPVVYPKGGGFFLSCPLEKGDNVLLVFCDNALDEFFLSSGSIQVDPINLRMHDISDAVAIPGLFTQLTTIKDVDGINLVLGKDQGGMKLKITPTGKAEFTLGIDSSKHVAISEYLEILWNSFKTLFDVWANTITGHVHLDPASGSTSPPTASLVVPDWNTLIKSTKVSIPDG